MILRQYLHEEATIAASYILGCGSRAMGAVIDPVAEPAFYLEEASRLGLGIRYAIDTHVHADHVSTARAVAAAAGGEYVLHESAEAAFVFRSVHDGEQLELGNTIIEVLHTPGHTPEHVSLLVTDRARGGDPWLVLTGHTLMVGDMGRTELATTAEDGARALFGSARRLAALPDHIEVLPGAFSGSVCGRGLSGKPTSTIGFERRFNRAFRIDHLEEFIALMLRDIPQPPPNAQRVRLENLGRTPAVMHA